MKKAPLASALILLGIALCLMGSPAVAAEVSQGKCIQFDEVSRTIVIEAYGIQFSEELPYGNPTGKMETFDVSTAAMGIRPEAGDILRMAWVEKDNVRSALKVMNVSKQDLRKK